MALGLGVRLDAFSHGVEGHRVLSNLFLGSLMRPSNSSTMLCRSFCRWRVTSRAPLHVRSPYTPLPKSTMERPSASDGAKGRLTPAPMPTWPLAVPASADSMREVKTAPCVDDLPRPPGRFVCGGQAPPNAGGCAPRCGQAAATLHVVQMTPTGRGRPPLMNAATVILLPRERWGRQQRRCPRGNGGARRALGTCGGQSPSRTGGPWSDG